MFEIKDITSTTDATGGKHINGASIRVTDESGNPVSDRCGRPIYRPAGNDKADLVSKVMYVIDDGSSIRLMSRKKLKKAYGYRQLKKAIRRYKTRTVSY